jgi:hypothetical protein
MTTDVTPILRQTSLLRAVPDHDLDVVTAASRLRSFRRGQIVFTGFTEADDSANRRRQFLTLPRSTAAAGTSSRRWR